MPLMAFRQMQNDELHFDFIDDMERLQICFQT